MVKRQIGDHVIEKAVQIYSCQPDIQHKKVAEMLGISDKTLRKMRRDPKFHKKVYDYYMVTFETDVVSVLMAMVREAKAGSTTAGRIVLEHSGKLAKQVNINLPSPWEQWINSKSIEEAEIIMNELPPRQVARVEKKINIEKVIKNEKKKTDWNARRRILHHWKIRGKAVNIPPLPNHRVTKGQRKEWEKSIVSAEWKANNGRTP